MNNTCISNIFLDGDTGNGGVTLELLEFNSPHLI